MDQDLEVKFAQEKLIQRITDALLAINKCAEDMTERGSGVYLKGEEYQFRIVGRKDDNDKFTLLYLRNNPQLKDVVIGDATFSHDDMCIYFEHIDNPPVDNFDGRLAKRVSLADIEDYLEMSGMEPWGRINKNKKKEVMKMFGLDANKKYTINRIPHRNRFNKVVCGLCITGSERIDREWLTSGLASFEAKTFTTDGALAHELRQMARQ